MKPISFTLKRIALLLISGLLILLALALLFIPYPYSQLFEEQEAQTAGEASMLPRYMAEITGINTPEEMQQQYERHPEEYRAGRRLYSVCTLQPGCRFLYGSQPGIFSDTGGPCNCGSEYM